MDKYRLRLDDHTVSLKEDGYTRDPTHLYLEFSTDGLTGVVSFIGLQIVNYYLKDIKLPAGKWKKEYKYYRTRYLDSNNNLCDSLPFNYRLITQQLRDKKCFDHNEFNLYKFNCYWMDVSSNIRSEFPFLLVDSSPKKQFGPNFPIQPMIDREGYVLTTFSPQLINRVLLKRRELVEDSSNIFEFHWLYEFKNIVNDIISLVDITLLQIYTKAEYDPKQGWTFNRNLLGEKYGRRLNDKLLWVRQITGEELNIEFEKQSLHVVRELRNHLNHFDPPTFACTLEEIAMWLNQILDVAMILAKIRVAIKEPLSHTLIELLLQKKVIFIPEKSFSDRRKLHKKTGGYVSSLWPKLA